MALQDSDNLIVGRGNVPYKITYQDLKDDLNYVPPPGLNLEVGKGSISPSVNLEEGDTLTGSATVTDAENPVVVHVWELDGVEVQRGSEATYVADAGSVRYRKEVTDDNNQSPKIGAWSDAVTVAEIIDDTVPNADMHGLRFDSARSTKLSRTGSGTGTISYWKKDSSTSWVWQHEHQTGAAYPAEIGAGYDGYMSDYYFVEGQDLPADTFVGQFDGKTGPLDSSDVYDNISKVQSPSDTCPNYDQKWSDNVTGDDTTYGPAANAFDNDLHQGWISKAFVVGGSTSTWTYSAGVAFTSQVRIYVNGYAEDVNRYGEFLVNGVAQTPTQGTTHWHTVTGISSPLTSISIQRKDPNGSNDTTSWGTDVKAIEVDGRILVDGPADNSQVWSDGVSSTGTILAGTPTNIFTGSITDQYVVNGTSASNKIRVDFSGLTDSSGSTLRVWTSRSSQITANLIVNGGSPIAIPVITTAESTYLDVLLASDLDHLEVIVATTDSNTSHGVALRQIALDGKILIDACPVWNTSQVWSSGGTTLKYGSWEYAFNGALPATPNINNTAFNDAIFGPGTVTFNPALSGNLRVWASCDTVTSNTPSTIVELSDGTTKTLTNGSDAIGWQDFGSVSSITSLTITATGSVNGTMLGGVELDDELLVDGGSFGANGFHLPFDPAATGVNYSSGQNTNVNFPEKLFDGDLSEAATVSSGGANDSYSIKLPVAITAKTGVDIYVEGNANGEGVRQLKNNGTVVSTLNATTTEGWQSFLNSAVTFDEITSSRTASSHGGGNNGIRVDGKLLVDHNNIGVDASGQDNHFHDQNFAVGSESDLVIELVNGGQQWSQENGFNGTPQATVAANATDNSYFHVTPSRRNGEPVHVYPKTPKSIQTISGVGTGGDTKVSFRGSEAVYGSNGTIWQINLGANRFKGFKITLSHLTLQSPNAHGN